tara:strand:- start:555 stop:776 length:222 start_codon:yes stop_codon:yes gene_type:complete
MKIFSDIREKKMRGMPPGEHVFDTKVNRISLMIHKDKGKFITYVDGDKLDTYRTQKEAEKAGRLFIKQYRKYK